tara:strand:- start:764 stop:2512 length:1749 start_codon:yes stop_codon:yes gene_type:complete
MKLLSLSKKIILFIFLLFFLTSVSSEDSVDIWNKKNLNNNEDASPTKQLEKNKSISNIQLTNKKNDINEIQIDSALNENNNDLLLYGIFDPEENNFKLNMWENSEGSKIKDVLDRINKIKLSPFAEEIFINTIFTYSNSPPKKMSEEKFLGYKLNWLINNQKDELLKTFLNKNKEFPHKTKVIKYLVDKSISNAKIKDGCKNINFISKEIKDSYLEQFKILCLILDNKKNQAFLLLDILREQNLSNKFFDTHINSLLGINSKNLKISDKNLLNFYLSSITVPNFSYEPNEKTDKFIWEYLNAANLITIENIEDQQKIKNLEIAANNNTLNKTKIFEIYRNIPFNLANLLRAEDIYQSLDPIESRALIYQKFLLSDGIDRKLKLLFVLDDLFKKDKLSNIYKEFLSDELKKINSDKIPDEYASLVERNIISEKSSILGRIKYNDKKYHTSKIIRYYTEEGTPKQKSQKDFDSVHKKLRKNKKYFISLKDLVLLESLESDGFNIPKDMKYKNIAKEYNPPVELTNLRKNQEIGFLALKLVEVIGEDKIEDFDPESIYFINYLLNTAGLKKFRNRVLISALPKRE